MDVQTGTAPTGTKCPRAPEDGGPYVNVQHAGNRAVGGINLSAASTTPYCRLPGRASHDPS